MQQKIMQEARAWLGTRFRHQGRCKRTDAHDGGVDCLGLLIGVAAALDLRDRHGALLTTHDRTDYPTHPDGGALQCALNRALYPIALNALTPADIALFAYERNPQHLGIITTYDTVSLGILHAYAPAKCVVEHTLDDSWQTKMIAAFRLPCVDRRLGDSPSPIDSLTFIS
jgi:hypothetical protein